VIIILHVEAPNQELRYVINLTWSAVENWGIIFIVFISLC